MGPVCCDVPPLRDRDLLSLTRMYSYLVEPNGYIQWDEHDHVSQKVVTADPAIDPKSVQAVLDYVRPIDDMMGART